VDIAASTHFGGFPYPIALWLLESIDDISAWNHRVARLSASDSLPRS
jgi:hypothetical protein